MEIDPFHDPLLQKKDNVPVFKRFKKLLRKADIYALPITLRYKAEKKFYTNFGAATSVLIILTMLGFAASDFATMLADGSTSVM